MNKRYTISKLILFIQLLFVLINSNAQTGLNFQGVARTSNNIILASQPISLRLSILQGSASGTTEYTETRKVTTNAQGLFSVVIGDTDASSTIGNFSTINWKNTPKYLKIEMDAAAGNNYITMGTTQFQYVAYAQFASSVDADNIAGIVPIAKGGTGVTSLASLKAALAIDKTSIGLSNVDNTTDLLKPISTAMQTILDIKANTLDVSNSLANKVDKINGKDLSSNDYTTAEKTKLAAITGTNTGDQDLSSYATNSALALKVNAADLTTSLALKENTSNKSSAADLGGLSPSDVLFPTQKAVKDYVTANTSSGGVADGGITTIKLADGAVTDAKLATGISKSKVGLGNVENTALSTWAGSNNLTTVGTITSGTWSGTSIAIANGGTGATTTAAARTNLGLDNVDNTSDANKPVSTATQTALDLKLNSTGNAATATKLAATKNINGVAFDGSADIIITATADAGTLTGTTLKSTVTGSSLTSVGTLSAGSVPYSLLTGTVPTWNQNTTGNATTATTAITAGNITATTNTTLTSLSSLTTVGTITSGTWSGTSIAIANGGTGATTTAAARTNLGLDNVDNTSDANKPVSTATQTALDLKLNSTGNAATATKLAATKNINGVAFDGSADIIITATADAGTLTGTTLKSTVTGSSLTSVGTITSGVWSGTAVAVEKGGTGLTAVGTDGQVLTSTNAGTLKWTTPTTFTTSTAVFLPTIVIGTQQWMEKNLDVMTYRNGDVIPQVTDPTAWLGLTTGAWCYYNNDPANGEIYGKLYNWYAVNDPRGLAPQGWHIPTLDEWTTLGTLLGGNAVAGGKMKTTGTTRWMTPNSSATNESGFAGLPGGYRGLSGGFFNVGNNVMWWSATQASSTSARYRNLLASSGSLLGSDANIFYGFSVRCLRD